MSLVPIVLGLSAVAIGVGIASAQDKAKPKKDRNVITHEEIVESGAQNALQAIKRLRPNWLASRGAASLTGGGSKETGLGVYVDGVRRGQGYPELEIIALVQVKELRYYSAEEAVVTLGSENP